MGKHRNNCDSSYDIQYSITGKQLTLSTSNASLLVHRKLELKCQPQEKQQSFLISILLYDKKAVLPQGNRAMPQVFFSVEVRQQHSLQV